MAAMVTQPELDALLTLGQVMDFAQIPADDGNDPTNLRGAFLIATGASEQALPRVFGVIPESLFDTVIQELKLKEFYRHRREELRLHNRQNNHSRNGENSHSDCCGPCRKGGTCEG